MKVFVCGIWDVSNLGDYKINVYTSCNKKALLLFSKVNNQLSTWVEIIKFVFNMLALNEHVG